jgi:glycosyltransferase involved in cell wall biosynthesis
VWREIEAAHADWHLVLAGPDLDGYGEAMRRRSAELGLGERVTFTGMLTGEEKSCALANAGLFVLPTHSENFGIAVAEALAHGVPTITTYAAPWASLRDVGCGWWIPDDETSLREALQTAMHLESAELRMMGERGRTMVAREYSWERVGGEMLCVYLWLMGRAARPACVTV